jgi:hypothetical protein
VGVKNEPKKLAAAIVGHAGKTSVLVLAWPRRLMAQLQRFIVMAQPTAYPSDW